MARTKRINSQSLLRYHTHIRSTNNTSRFNSQLNSHRPTPLQFSGDLRTFSATHDSTPTMAKAKEYSLVSYNTVFSGNDVPTPDNQVPAFSQESFWQPPGNRVAAYHTPTTQTMSPMFNFPSPVPDFNDLFDLPNLTSWDRNDEQVSVQHSPSTVTTDVSQMTPIDPVLLELDNHSALEIGETDGGHAERRCSSTGLPSPQLLHTKGEWLPLRSAQIAFNEQTYKKPTSNGGATYVSSYVETNYNNNLQGYPSPPQSEQQNSLRPGSVSPQFAAHAKLDQYDEASVTKAAILGMYAPTLPATLSYPFRLDCTYSLGLLTFNLQISLPHCSASASMTKILASTPSSVHAESLKTR
jgi:hypothetical protein